MLQRTIQSRWWILVGSLAAVLSMRFVYHLLDFYGTLSRALTRHLLAFCYSECDLTPLRPTHGGSHAYHTDRESIHSPASARLQSFKTRSCPLRGPPQREKQGGAVFPRRAQMFCPPYESVAETITGTHLAGLAAHASICIDDDLRFFECCRFGLGGRREMAISISCDRTRRCVPGFKNDKLTRPSAIIPLTRS